MSSRWISGAGVTPGSRVLRFGDGDDGDPDRAPADDGAGLEWRHAATPTAVVAPSGPDAGGA